MIQGYLALVLHAHLPFVRHPEFEEFLEEDWFFQAVTETYIPLIHVFEGLQRDRVPFAVTMSLTPTLLSMLADPLLQERCLRHLDRSLEFAEKELHRTRKDPAFHPLARMYHRRFSEARATFRDRYDGNLIMAFRRLADAGCLDILTCAATHGFLPFMEAQPEALRAQIQVAVRTHARLLGRNPGGIWLPECAYTPGLERWLEEAGLGFFFLDTHGVLHASPRPKYGVYAPVQCQNGVAALARDPETSKQVWSAHEGYPGDPVYRDFYRDAGFDLPYDYVRPYIASTGDRKMTGFKYYRITGDTDQKEPYQPEWAKDKTAEHAANFMFNRERQVEHLRGAMGREPLVVSMYDAELFGHWWSEGPWWLDHLIRKSAYDQQVYQLITPRRFLEQSPQRQTVNPVGSSWGHKGYYEYWMNEKNDWIYPHLHTAAERMTALARRFPKAGGLSRRALNQAARELLLAQSSDWAFIMTAGTMVDYAVKRTREHLNRFLALNDQLLAGTVDQDALADMESRNNLFPDLDYEVYA